jgi:ribosomal protein L37AE/L43A
MKTETEQLLDDVRKLWTPGKQAMQTCPDCKTELRHMSKIWSKCPKCGIRIYHGKINDVAAMPNVES